MVLNEQIKNPKPKDWWCMVQDDLRGLKVDVSQKEISDMSMKNWKTLINSKSYEYSFNLLLDRKKKIKFKGKNVIYNELSPRAYLLPDSGFNMLEMKTLLKLRTDTLEVPKCFPFKYEGIRKCRYGCSSEEDTKHVITCKNDKIHKVVEVKDIENALNNIYTIQLKPKLQELVKIVKFKNNTSNTIEEVKQYNKEVHTIYKEPEKMETIKK